MNKKDFEINGVYTDLKNQEWIVVNKDENFVYCRLKNGGPYPKKFRRTVYINVNGAVFDFGQNRILAEKIVPQVDPEIDGTLRICQDKINTNGESYVNLFKEHQEKN